MNDFPFCWYLVAEILESDSAGLYRRAGFLTVLFLPEPSSMYLILDFVWRLQRLSVLVSL